MNKKQRIIGILVIGVILLGVMFFQNIKIYGKQFWYPTKQYLAINKNDDIQLSLVFVDGKRKAEEVEASLGTIAFLDENGKQYKSKNQKLKVLESNKVYGVYQIDLQLDKMEIGEYVLNQLICNGKEYEIGSIVLDVMDGMEDYEFELEMGPMTFGGTYGFTIKNTTKDTIKVLNLYYDFKGGKKEAIGINEEVPIGEKKYFTVDITELYGKNAVLSAYVELDINGETNNIILSVPTSSFEGLTKQDILDYIKEEGKSKK
ncbi:MAG: hypothetical protein II992_11405 [Lachnospiraceae bacterium]|nr:hypothetical protein [Lachnospiraceae bacterium]